MHRFVLAAFFLMITLLPTQAARFALVIGIDGYEKLPRLHKAANDARAVAATLTAQGFAVTLLEDPGRRAMTRAISDLAAGLSPGDEALFYFAGHGVEIAGRNYLLPADAPAVKPAEESFLTAESVAADDVVQTFQDHGAAITVLILDACRDNPFPREGTRSAGGARGLAPLVPPEGAFILFSAGAGQTALDRLGSEDADPNSVFTRALVPLLSQTGLTLPELARRLRGEVEATAATIGHKQRPAYYDELTGDYQIAAAADRRGAVPLPDGSGGKTRAPVADPAACAAAAVDWPSVVALADPVTLRAFAETHVACAPLHHAALAEAERLDRAAPPPVADPDTDPALAGISWRVRAGVSQGFINVRSGPGTMHDVLFTLPAGTGNILALECRPPDPGGGSFDWCRIRLNRQEGWVSSNGIEQE